MRVAFDCDGTLLNTDGTLRDEVCRLLIAFLNSNAEVVVWSGGGKNYAENVWNRVAVKYGIAENEPDLARKVYCSGKDGSLPDLTFDDMWVNLGNFNVCWPPKNKQEES